MYMIHQLICSYSYWESRVYLLHSHTTTFSKSGGATCFTPVTDWGMLSIISHPHDEMSMVGGLSFRAAFQISTCKWHLNKCWINASSVGGRIFMLGVGFAANEILMAKKFHGLLRCSTVHVWEVHCSNFKKIFFHRSFFTETFQAKTVMLH